MNREQLNDFAREAGADIFGVASIDRFDGLPPERHPAAIFPETATVLVIGRRITRGTLRGVEEGTNFSNYAHYGRDWLENRFLALTTFTVAEFLEDNGQEAVPLPNIAPQAPTMGVRVCPGRPEPNVLLDFDDAAVRAGVGEIGYCGILLTPVFGPRQRLQLILTDATLPPDPPLAGAICPRDGDCRGFCPLGALGEPEKQLVGGRATTVANIDYRQCASCRNGATANSSHPAGRPDRLAAICTRSCADYLEKSGRIKNRFKNPFRRREPWTIRETPNPFRF